MRCGLIGEKLGHSHSKTLHGLLADYRYDLIELAPEELGPFLKKGEFDGLNVTIPYKQAVIPYLRELNPDPLLEINPVTAQERNIADGQWVRVWNMFGEALMKAKVTEAVDEKTVHGQHGWWFPEESGDEPNLYGTFRSQINNLCPNGHMGKLGFGAPNKCMCCNVEPIAESYDTDMNLIWEKFGKLV